LHCRPDQGRRNRHNAVDNFFGLPNVHIPPGQLMNARFINGVPNPFFGIPRGQLKKLPTVNGVINPFFDEAPGHWMIPDDFFPGESLSYEI
jgi:hypothetical protein